jgi:hypothetical protein
MALVKTGRTLSTMVTVEVEAETDAGRSETARPAKAWTPTGDTAETKANMAEMGYTTADEEKRRGLKTDTKEWPGGEEQ